jgi:hypothetical protein
MAWRYRWSTMCGKKESPWSSSYCLSTTRVPHARDDLVEEGVDLGQCIEVARRGELPSDRVRRLEAEVDLHNLLEAAHDEPPEDKEHTRHGYFGHHKHLP